jgi:hypothetical protein
VTPRDQYGGRTTLEISWRVNEQSIDSSKMQCKICAFMFNPFLHF